MRAKMKIDPLVKCVCVRVHMKQKNSVQFNVHKWIYL